MRDIARRAAIDINQSSVEIEPSTVLFSLSARFIELSVTDETVGNSWRRLAHQPRSIDARDQQTQQSQGHKAVHPDSFLDSQSLM
jgi:hypothetical protein